MKKIKTRGIQMSKVLFVCVHNTARSQMAEAFLRDMAGDRFSVDSAGLERGEAINPYVIRAMQEIGVDISGNSINSVEEYLSERRQYDYVITVCSASKGEQCPIFPGKGKRIHIEFDDPAGLTGSDVEIMTETRRIRDEIKAKVAELITLMNTSG